MNSPAAYQPEQPSSDESLLAADGYNPSTAMSCDASSDVSGPLDEICEQLDAWVRELEQEHLADPPPSAGHEIPDPLPALTPEQAIEAYIEFLKALSHDELLDAAVELRAERDTLFRRLAILPDLSRLETMRGRFQKVVEEVESLHARNEVLEIALAAQPSADAECEEDYAGDEDDLEDDEEFETDWETQKSQWLTRLQDDGQTSSAPASELDKAKSEKQKQLVRQLKDENAELRRQLDEKTEADKLLDKDQVICQERQRLTELQQVWEKKLREAEVDVSRERAEITRNRKKLEERERTLKALQEDLDQGGNENSGKWRGILGLNK